MFADQRVKAGQTVNFDVNVEGEPNPKIEWFVQKNEEKILRSYMEASRQINFCSAEAGVTPTDRPSQAQFWRPNMPSANI